MQTLTSDNPTLIYVETKTMTLQEINRFDEIAKMFAYFGFIDTPLKSSEIDQLIKMKMDNDAIYEIGCDCLSGFQFCEALKYYQ